MSTARAVLGNTFVQIAGKLVTAAISIVIIKLITVYLGRAGYGEYTTVYEFLTFFAIAADFGIFQIAVREMSREPSRRDAIFGNILGVRMVLTIAAMIVAVASAFLIPAYEHSLIPLGIAVGSITTLFTLLTGTLSAALQTSLRMQWAVIAAIAGKFVALGYMLWVIFVAFPADTTTGFYHLLIAGNVGNLVMAALTYVFTRRLVDVRMRFEWIFWRDVLLKALPYGTALILATIYFRIGAVLLSILRSPEEVGVYGVALRVVENLQMVPVFFLNSMLPILTRLLVDDKTKFKKAFRYAFDFLLVLALPMFVGGYVLAYPLVAVVASPEFLTNLSAGFYGSDIALRIMLGAMTVAFIGNLMSYTLLAANEQRKLMIINFSVAAFNIAANLIAIPLWGFRGTAFVGVASEVIVAAAGTYFVWRMTGATPGILRPIKIAAAAIVMGVVVWWLQPITYAWIENVNILALVPVGGLVYAGLLFATRAIDRDMLKLVLRKKEPVIEESSGSAV